MTITVVGLGPADADDLTRRAWRAIETAPTVFVRTAKHPCIPHLPTDNLHPFDDLYEQYEAFDDVYEAIVAALLAHEGDCAYAVPGDPFVAESTVAKLLPRAEEAGVTVEVISGLSFIEPTLAALKIDALDGLQLVDALAVAAMHHPPLNPDYPALLAQAYSTAVASNVKLTLMNQYPDDFPVVLVHGAGSENAHIEHMPLYEIDRSAHIDVLTSLYIPALGGMTSFEQAQEIIAHLRAPEGCPWDREQTHASLRRHLIEESAEVLEAIDHEDWDHLAEELGDLMLQILLHAQIATEDGAFTMADVLRHINTKMIRRHPHVWGDATADNPDAVVSNWEAIKAAEKGDDPAPPSVLDGIPSALPALLQAYELGRKAAKVGFDWPTVDGVEDKIREEMGELSAAQDAAERAAEAGDLLFVIANWLRWQKIEPETALRDANAKFVRRFQFMESQANGRPLAEHTLDELEAYWQAAKRAGL